MSNRNFYSLYPDDKEERIAELELQVEELRGKHSVNETGVTDFFTVTRLQKEVDFLELAARKQRCRRQHLEDEVKYLLVEVEILNKALFTPALKEENLVEMMMRQLESKTEELAMSRQLITEMQNVAFSDSTNSIVSWAQSVLDEFKETKVKESELRLERSKMDRKMLETMKQKVVLEKAYNDCKELMKDLKRKQKEYAKEHEDALVKMGERWQSQELQRTAQQRQVIEMLECQIAELKVQVRRPNTPEMSPTDVEARPKTNEEMKHPSGNQPKSLTKPTRPAAPVKKTDQHGGKKTQKVKADAAAESLNEPTIAPSQESKESLPQGFGNDHAMMMELEMKANFFQEKLDEKEYECEELRQEIIALKQNLKNCKGDASKTEGLIAKNYELTQENIRLQKDWHIEIMKRKRLFNLCEELKGKIRVYVRVRPLLTQEKEKKECITFPDEFSIVVKGHKQSKEFIFDRVFPPTADQQTVFQDTEFLIQSAVDGFNTCILAYGQTGSGKTFTLLGDEQENLPGIAPRIFTRLFQIVEEMKDQFEFSISAYMLELYNEKLLDLLSNNAKYSESLEIRKDVNGLMYVKGVTIKDAECVNDLQTLFKTGLSVRHVAATKMNTESSRSHLIISILIESENIKMKQVCRGKLSIIDLAGSERIAKTAATGETLKEGTAINMSLSALGDVISALTSEQNFVPYRNNKLTMLLQDSLGGNAKSLMFVNVSPAEINSAETLNSLSYGNRVKLIKNEPTKNSESAELANLRKEVRALKKSRRNLW